MVLLDEEARQISQIIATQTGTSMSSGQFDQLVKHFSDPGDVLQVMSANDELLQLLKTFGVDATKLNANELKIIQDIALKYEVRTPSVTTTTVGDLSSTNLAKDATAFVVKFDPKDVDAFLDAKLAQIPEGSRFFLIGESQPRLRYAARILGHRQALEFWPENMKFTEYVAALHEQASIDFNTYLIRKLHEKGFNFFDLGADVSRKIPGSSPWYQAELEVLNELGVKPIKITPKFEIPNFKQ